MIPGPHGSTLHASRAFQLPHSANISGGRQARSRLDFLFSLFKTENKPHSPKGGVYPSLSLSPGDPQLLTHFFFLRPFFGDRFCSDFGPALAPQLDPKITEIRQKVSPDPSWERPGRNLAKNSLPSPPRDTQICVLYSNYHMNREVARLRLGSFWAAFRLPFGTVWATVAAHALPKPLPWDRSKAR